MRDRSRRRGLGTRSTSMQLDGGVRITTTQLALQEIAEQIVKPQHRRRFIDRRDEKAALVQAIQHRRGVRSTSHSRAQRWIELRQHGALTEELLAIVRQVREDFLR